MKKNLSRVSYVVSIVLLFSILSYAQHVTRGEISGVVVDKEGEILPGATVTLTGEKLFQKSISAVSNEKGLFRFLNLVAGTYQLEFSLPGFNTLKMSTVPVHVGRATPVRANLAPAAIKEEVEVVADAPLIETKSPQLTTNIDTMLMENIPAGRRYGYADLMNAAPGFHDNMAYGSAGNVSSSGFHTGSYTVAIRINGVDVSHAQGGYSSVNPINETIEELQIVGIGASAEYGNYIGASVNIVTKSGTNRVHGSLTGFYTDSNYYADNSGGFEAYESHYYKYDGEVSATFSGPLIEEKLFFFLGAGYAATSMRWRGSEGFNSIIRPRYYAKLDWLANPKNTFTLMWNGNPGTMGNMGLYEGYPESRAYKMRLLSDALLANWQSILGPQTYLELKIGGYRDTSLMEPEYPGVPSFSDYGTSSYYGSYSMTSDYYSSRIEAYGALTHYADELFGASHELKLGFEFDRAQAGQDRVWTGGGTMYMIPLGALTLWSATAGGEQHTLGKITRVCGYIQDNIKISRKLNLNIGVRIETAATTARDFSGNVAKLNMLSPRLGFSYDFGGDAKNVIRGSWGIYYNKLLLAPFQYCMPGNEDRYSYRAILPAVPFEPTDESIKNQYALITQPQYLSYIQYYATPTPVDTDLKHIRTDMYSIGFAKKLGANFALSIDYTHKRDSNRFQMLSLVEHTYEETQYTDPWLGNTISLWVQTDRNPDTEKMLTNSTWAKKRHHLIMVVLRKQPTHNWSTMVSYVWQNSKSNLPFLGYTDLYGSPEPNLDTDPHYTKNPLQWGRQWDREHQFKWLTSYFGPWGLTIGADFRVMSGLAWHPEVWTFQIGMYRSTGSTFVPLEQRGSRRAPMTWNLNLRLAKVFKIAGSHLELRLDIFNVFNADYTIQIQWDPTRNYPGTTISQFGKPRSLKPPRSARFGLTWRF